MSWEYAARFANWVHNGRVSEEWAFEDGVYDMSTFGSVPDDEAVHDFVRSPAARVWLPTEDEWVKAVHYDPDRYGAGEGGYWTYPNGSEERLVEGVPGVGECIGGLLETLHPERLDGAWDLGQYPGTMTPWGLLDTSGTAQEWTSTPKYGLQNPRICGSEAGEDDYWIYDRLANESLGILELPLGAIRLAAAPPPCNRADLALPHGVHDFLDVYAFLTAFVGGEPAADLAEPMGVFDISDALRFLELFGSGCPLE